MSDMSESIAFALPKRPRIKEKDAPPDQRKVCVMPIRAVFDKRMSHGALQALAALCAYCNRAGITWVSQTRLAQELGISQQAVAKQFKQLRELGYLQTVRKGFKGERTDTLRVVFDPSITAEEAITMTSNKEDTRPPAIIQEQARQAEEIDREGQARIARLISKALKQPLKQEKTMPASGQTRTVKKMKEDIQKAKQKGSPGTTKPVDNHVDKHAHIHNPQVVHGEGLHSQPNHNLEVVDNTGEHIRENIYKVNTLNTIRDHRLVLHNQTIKQLLDFGLTDQDIDDGLTTLLAIYRAEGITPKEQHLVEGLMQMHRDAA
jgi:predicted ArsR family transcriptional regulator